jgi:hypothetical protein
MSVPAFGFVDKAVTDGHARASISVRVVAKGIDYPTVSVCGAASLIGALFNHHNIRAHRLCDRPFD